MEGIGFTKIHGTDIFTYILAFVLMLCELCVGLGHDTVDGSEILRSPVEVGS